MSWLQEQVLENPQNLFIQESGHAYSVMDVMEMVQIYSHSLLRENIQPQDRILIYLPSGIELVEIILSCFEIGAIATSISRRLTKRERDAVIAIIQPRFIITNWTEQETFEGVSFPLTCIEELPSSSGICSVVTNEYEKNGETKRTMQVGSITIWKDGVILSADELDSDVPF